MTTTSPAELAAGRWTVDLANSSATFRVRSFGRTVTGSVPITEGAVEVDGGRPTAITGSLDLSAIDTGNARRDSDLRKPRLLDLDHHPARPGDEAGRVVLGQPPPARREGPPA